MFVMRQVKAGDSYRHNNLRRVEILNINNNVFTVNKIDSLESFSVPSPVSTHRREVSRCPALNKARKNQSYKGKHASIGDPDGF